jgi:glycosyltransferase involved in cell wall biosynthesis
MGDRGRSRSKKDRVAISDIFVSAVVPADHFADDIAGYVKKLTNLLAKHYTNYEVLVIDNSMTPMQIQELIDMLDKVACVRILRLSRRHNKDTAIFSGLEASIGDFVCVMNPVLDPPEVVIDMIATNRSGIDIVQGVSTIPVDGKVYARWGRTLFYWYNRRFLDTEIPLNATYLVSFNRRAVNAITSTNRSQRYIRHLSRRIGFRLDTFEYKPMQHPRSDRTLKTGVVEALEIITSLSSHPLRFITWLGVMAALINLAYAVYVVILNLTASSLAEGWTTLSLQASVMFFFLFVILAIMSEYLGSILAESRQGSPYHVIEELTSTVGIADETRRNVTS